MRSACVGSDCRPVFVGGTEDSGSRLGCDLEDCDVASEESIDQGYRARCRIPKWLSLCFQTATPVYIRTKTGKVKSLLTRLLVLRSFVMIGGVLCTGVVTAATSSFTYQGRLTEGAVAASGTFDFRFGLWGSKDAGNQVGGALDANFLLVSNGVFTATLDFGPAAFTGGARWIELAVRNSGSSLPHTVLPPRQPVTATPYALYALTPAGPPGLKGDPGVAGSTGPPGPSVTASNFLFIGADSNGNQPGSRVSLGTDGRELVTLMENGNLGIGTTNPGVRLEIVGMVKALGFSGSGAGLSNLPPTALSGALSAAQLPSDLVYQAGLLSVSNSLQSTIAAEAVSNTAELTGVRSQLRTTSNALQTADVTLQANLAATNTALLATIAAERTARIAALAQQLSDLLGGNSLFAGSNRFDGAVIATNRFNRFVGSFDRLMVMGEGEGTVSKEPEIPRAQRGVRELETSAGGRRFRFDVTFRSGRDLSRFTGAGGQSVCLSDSGRSRFDAQSAFGRCE